jgi:hypothetical protein
LPLPSPGRPRRAGGSKFATRGSLASAARPGPGGGLLVAAGLCLGGWVLFCLPHRADWTAFLLFTLALPPLVAGLLLAGPRQMASYP